MVSCVHEYSVLVSVQWSFKSWISVHWNKEEDSIPNKTRPLQRQLQRHHFNGTRRPPSPCDTLSYWESFHSLSQKHNRQTQRESKSNNSVSVDGKNSMWSNIGIWHKEKITRTTDSVCIDSFYNPRRNNNNHFTRCIIRKCANHWKHTHVTLKSWDFITCMGFVRIRFHFDLIMMYIYILHAVLEQGHWEREIWQER